MKKILLLLMIINLILAYDINELIKIEAKLYPKIMRLEKSIQDKTLKVAIIYNRSSQKFAKKFAFLLKKQLCRRQHEEETLSRVSQKFHCPQGEKVAFHPFRGSYERR